VFIPVQGEILPVLLDAFMKFTLSEPYKEYKAIKAKKKVLTKTRKELNTPRNLLVYCDALTKKEEK